MPAPVGVPKRGPPKVSMSEYPAKTVPDRSFFRDRIRGRVALADPNAEPALAPNTEFVLAFIEVERDLFGQLVDLVGGVRLGFQFDSREDRPILVDVGAAREAEAG